MFSYSLLVKKKKKSFWGLKNVLKLVFPCKFILFYRAHLLQSFSVLIAINRSTKKAETLEKPRNFKIPVDFNNFLHEK